MKKFIFTFPGNHPLKNNCQPIFANNMTIARNKIFEIYGDKWGFQYTNEKWEAWKQKAKRIGIPIEKELAPIYAEEVQYVKEG